jgi:hypothetical protein
LLLSSELYLVYPSQIIGSIDKSIMTLALHVDTNASDVSDNVIFIENLLSVYVIDI